MIPKDWYVGKSLNDTSWQVPSKSEKGKVHNVGFNKAKNEWTCTCTAGLMGHDTCRHIRQIQHQLKDITWKSE